MKKSFIFLFFIWFCTLYANDAMPDVRFKQNDSIISRFDVAYHREPLSSDPFFGVIRSLHFDQLGDNVLSEGYTSDWVWGRFRLHNDSSRARTLVLEFSEMFHDTIELYVVEDDGEVLRFDAGLRSEKEKKYQGLYPNPVFELMFLPYESKEIYLKIHSAYSLFGALEIKTPEKLHQEQLIKHAVFFFFFGAVLTILFYNFIMYFSLRDKLYLYYVGYGTIFLIWAANYKGYISLLFGNRYYDILNFTVPIYFILLILFTQTLLQTKKHLPKLHVALYGSIVLMIFVGLLMWWDMHYGFYVLSYGVTPIFVFLLYAAIYSTLYKTSLTSNLYLLGMVIYTAGMIIITLLSLGKIEYTYLYSIAPIIGTYFEVILFSLVLAHRINSIKTEAIRFQEELLKQKRSESSRLFYMVAEKTKELNRANRKLEEELRKKVKLEKDLILQANNDPLTGLLNRRGFFKQVSHKLQQNPSAFACIVLDIDHFKHINDTYGHPFGDKVIRAIAQKMRECTRGQDIVGRIGGEEFAIVMPDTDLASAETIAERLRRFIAKSVISDNEISIAVTVSLGLTLSLDNKEDIEAVIGRADEALYKAKKEGRNRVCIL